MRPVTIQINSQILRQLAARKAISASAIALAAMLIIGSAGCNRSSYPNPYPYPPVVSYPANTQAAAGPGAPPATGPQSVYAQQQTAPQLVQLQQQVKNLDADNRLLTAQIAQLQQQSQAVRNEKELLARQLQDSVNQYKQLASTSQQYAAQARGMQASMEMRGGARLTANNSLRGAAAGLQIEGAQVLQDGELIRIRLPADILFTPGSAMISPGGTRQLDQIATAVGQQFARQRVAIEGHTDAAQVYGGFGTPYKMAGEQAQAVMDQLVQRNRLPTQQLFVVAHGPNHPLADNQTAIGQAANRRVEVVIYPDSF